MEVEFKLNEKKLLKLSNDIKTLMANYISEEQVDVNGVDLLFTTGFGRQKSRCVAIDFYIDGENYRL